MLLYLWMEQFFQLEEREVRKGLKEKKRQKERKMERQKERKMERQKERKIES